MRPAVWSDIAPVLSFGRTVSTSYMVASVDRAVPRLFTIEIGKSEPGPCRGPGRRNLFPCSGRELFIYPVGF